MTSSYRLNYVTRGDAQRPTLLLVHGFLSSNAQWLPNVAALETRYHLVLAELWGHGDSPLPEDDAYSIDRYVHEFDHIREQEGIERWGVVGQSYAAGLTVRYALTHPERVAGLVLTNSRSAFGNIKRARADKATRIQSRQPMQRDRNRHMPIHPVYARRFPDDVKTVMVEAADNMSPEAIEKGGRIGSELNAVALIGELSMPVMLANGRFEKGFQADADKLRDRYPELPVVDMDGGHAVNIEAAEEFNRSVLEFFQPLL